LRSARRGRRFFGHGAITLLPVTSITKPICSRRSAGNRMRWRPLVSTAACGCRACWSVLSLYAIVLVRAPRHVVAPDIRHRTLVGEYRKRATMHGVHWAICAGGGGVRERQRAISTAKTNAQLDLCSYRWASAAAKLVPRKYRQRSQLRVGPKRLRGRPTCSGGRRVRSEGLVSAVGAGTPTGCCNVS